MSCVLRGLGSNSSEKVCSVQRLSLVIVTPPYCLSRSILWLSNCKSCSFVPSRKQTLYCEPLITLPKRSLVGCLWLINGCGPRFSLSPVIAIAGSQANVWVVRKFPTATSFCSKSPKIFQLESMVAVETQSDRIPRTSWMYFKQRYFATRCFRIPSLYPHLLWQPVRACSVTCGGGPTNEAGELGNFEMRCGGKSDRRPNFPCDCPRSVFEA